MKIREVMTESRHCAVPSMTLEKVARKMRDLNCGLLPVSDSDGKKLSGVITYRDIVMRAVAEGLRPLETTADQIKTPHVIHCYSDDTTSTATNIMRENKIRRLVVLDNDHDKNLCGVVTLADVTQGSGETETNKQ